MAHVHDRHAARTQVRADRREELVGDQVERDVGLAVGVEKDRVVTMVTLIQPWTSVRGVGVEPRAGEAEVATSDARQHAVELDGVDPRRAEVVAVRPRDRPGRIAENRDPLDRVRRAAQKDKDVRFTALLHHVGCRSSAGGVLGDWPEGRAGGGRRDVGGLWR